MRQSFKFVGVAALLASLAAAGVQPMHVPLSHLRNLVSRPGANGTPSSFADSFDSSLPSVALAIFALGALGLVAIRSGSRCPQRLEDFPQYIRPPPSR